jgi:hypothetical protein
VSRVRHVVFVAVGALAPLASPALAQGTWDAILAVDPVPSPYLSDWEANPDFGTLTVFNGSGQPQSVRLVFNVVDGGGRLVADGASEPQLISGDAPAIFDSPFEIAGSTRHDEELEGQMRRTGRLPEGEYRACVAVVDLGGFQLAEACESFSVVYPDPPLLIAPYDGDAVTSQDFFFQWTPAQVPADFGLRYVLEVVDVRPGQLPAEALQSNLLHFYDPDVASTQVQYPLDAQPLEAGGVYAWQVKALDVNGYPVSANQGRSEVWTFTYQPEPERAVSAIALTVARDTLRYAGDTVRFAAKAFDAGDFEIPDVRFQWHALDTTVARVDGAGLVTGVGPGETRIVATVDGIADSALTVLATPTGLTVRFAQYDADADQPTLLQLVQSGSFDEVVPRLMEMLQTGEFVIPIPRLPGLDGNAAGGSGGDAGDDWDNAGDAPGGPWAEWRTPRSGARRPADQCDGVVVSGVDPELDTERRVFALFLGSATELGGCVPKADSGGTDEGTVVDTTFHNSAVFAISWEHPGLPRIFLALKGIGQLPLPLAGTEVRLRYIVVNFLRTATMESALLPAKFAGFFGSESFDAGVGLTIHSKRRCVNADTPVDEMRGVCWLLSTINEREPDITVHAFAGVTASETSGGSGGLGTSTALGFSIAATSPVGRLGWDSLPGWDFPGSFDSLQVGLLFAAQDSMVQQVGQDQAHNFSLGVAGTFTLWLTGSGGNTWQVDGSVGLEWDPTGEQALRPKLVLSAQVPQVWKLWVIRLGNPQLVFTTPIGPRDERQATEVAVSGTWGFGPPEGVGIDEGGGDVRGDVGGGAGGGVSGFEEFGRGQVVLSWKRPATQKTRDASKADRDSAIAAVTRHLHVYRAARQRERQASQDRGLARESGNAERIRVADSAYTVAKKELDEAEATLARLRQARDQAQEALRSPPCPPERTRCFTWSGRLSVGNGSLADFLVMIQRFLMGAL